MPIACPPIVLAASPATFITEFGIRLMESPYSQLFISGLLKGEKQWQNIPYVLRVTIKSLHDLLLQQQLQIKELTSEKKNDVQSHPTTLPRDLDSRIRYIMDEHLPRHPVFTEHLNPLKMKTYQLENKIRQKANSLDVSNLLKTKLDAETFDNQKEQLKLEWKQQLRNSSLRSKKETEKFYSERIEAVEEKLSSHENQLKDLLPRFDRLLRNWGSEKSTMKSQINQLKQSLEETNSQLKRKVEVNEVSSIIQQRVQEKAQDTLKRVNALFEGERQSLAAVRDRMKESMKRFHEERSQMETNLASRLSSKVEIETVNSWIEKHTNELNSILKRIRDVELTDVKKELKDKVSVQTYRGLLMEQEKVRDEVQFLSNEKEKKVVDERKVNAALDQLKTTISGFNAKVMTRVSKVEYLQDLGKLKAMVENRCRDIEQRSASTNSNNNNNMNQQSISTQDLKRFANSMRDDIENVVKKYMTKKEIEDYFEEKLAKLRKSIETLHRSIGQLLVLNQSSADQSGVGGGINLINSSSFLSGRNKKGLSSTTSSTSTSSSTTRRRKKKKRLGKMSLERMSEIPSNILSSIEIDRINENDISVDDNDDLEDGDHILKEFNSNSSL